MLMYYKIYSASKQNIDNYNRVRVKTITLELLKFKTYQIKYLQF